MKEILELKEKLEGWANEYCEIEVNKKKLDYQDLEDFARQENLTVRRREFYGHVVIYQKKYLKIFLESNN